MSLPTAELDPTSDFTALVTEAKAARVRNEREQSLLQWNEAILRFPDRMEGYLGAAGVLLDLQRYDEADTLLEEAIRRFPDEPAPAFDYARVGHYRRNWTQCLARWETARARYPDLLDGFRGEGAALRDAGRYAEADVVHEAGMRRFPEDFWLAVGHAQTARFRRDWSEALRRWEFVRDRFDNEAAGHSGVAEALSELGLFEDARVALQGAAAVAVDDVASQRQLAAVELQAGNHEAALKRVAAIRAAHPEAAADVGPDMVGVLISRDPVIIQAATYSFEELVAPTMAYYEKTGRRVHYLVNSNMSIVFEHRLRDRLVREAAEMQQRFPQASLTFLVNDVAELAAARQVGFDAILLSNNAFVDERIFTIASGASKRFDAVYNARFAPYKRHHLATSIDNLVLIAAGLTGEHLEDLAELLPKAHLTTANVDSAKVVEIVNSARCGLCLSRAEGAMYAAIEYLLCGVPIVTTRSIGGRNWWLDDETTVYAEDDAADVARCVQRMLARDLSPSFVREHALQRIARERAIFIATVERIFAEEGQPGRRYAPEFARDFHDKWNYKVRPLTALLALP